MSATPQPMLPLKRPCSLLCRWRKWASRAQEAVPPLSRGFMHLRSLRPPRDHHFSAANAGPSKPGCLPLKHRFAAGGDCSYPQRSPGEWLLCRTRTKHQDCENVRSKLCGRGRLLLVCEPPPQCHRSKFRSVVATFFATVTAPGLGSACLRIGTPASQMPMSSPPQKRAVCNPVRLQLAFDNAPSSDSDAAILPSRPSGGTRDWVEFVEE